mgnify:CR=1 FL=1
MIMKKIILSILASALWINGYSQRTCGSELNMEQIRRTEPLKYQRITDWENQINYMLVVCLLPQF